MHSFTHGPQARKALVVLMAAVVACGAAGGAVAGDPDCTWTEVTMPAVPPGAWVVVCPLPDFARTVSLSQARLVGGVSTPVDASIQITWRDSGGLLASTTVPACDVWLSLANDPRFSPCIAKLCADGPSVASVSRFSTLGIPAGGRCETGCEVWYANGGIPCNLAALPIIFRSPDINGDGTVNLSDTVMFAMDLTGAYNSRSDFVPNGVIDLSDTVVFAGGLGSACLR